jgi:hypothetical protein
MRLRHPALPPNSFQNLGIRRPDIGRILFDGISSWANLQMKQLQSQKSYFPNLYLPLAAGFSITINALLAVPLSAPI